MHLPYGKDTLKAANKVRLTAEMEMPLRPLIQRKQIQQQPEKKTSKDKFNMITYKVQVTLQAAQKWKGVCD